MSKADTRSIASLARDADSASQRIDKLIAEKINKRDAFIKLLNEETAKALSFVPDPKHPNPFGNCYNAAALVERESDLNIALSFSKNDKLIDRFHNYIRYLQADNILDKTLTKHRLEDLIRSIGKHFDVNMVKMMEDIPKSMRTLYEYFRSATGFIDATKRSLSRNALKPEEEEK